MRCNLNGLYLARIAAQWWVGNGPCGYRTWLFAQFAGTHINGFLFLILPYLPVAPPALWGLFLPDIE